MPSEVLAPKLSVLRNSFERKDLDLAAIYIKTCDGVPDHAAELRRQVEKHKIDYPVLNGEAGKLSDPTRKKYPWAPHAVLIDREGRVVQAYGHMPAISLIERDLKELIASGRIPTRPDAGWRNFPRRAWVKLLFLGGEIPRLETRELKKLLSGKVVLTVETESDAFGKTKNEMSIAAALPSFDDRQVKVLELPKTSLKIDGRDLACRVLLKTWTRTKRKGNEVLMTQRSWIAMDPTLPDTLLRQETSKRRASGAVLNDTRVITTFVAQQTIGGRKLTCWVVEAKTEWGTGSSASRKWYSKKIPGFLAKSEETIVQHGNKIKTAHRAIAFDSK